MQKFLDIIVGNRVYGIVCPCENNVFFDFLCLNINDLQKNDAKKYDRDPRFFFHLSFFRMMKNQCNFFNDKSFLLLQKKLRY